MPHRPQGLVGFLRAAASGQRAAGHRSATGGAGTHPAANEPDHAPALWRQVLALGLRRRYGVDINAHAIRLWKPHAGVPVPAGCGSLGAVTIPRLRWLWLIRGFRGKKTDEMNLFWGIIR